METIDLNTRIIDLTVGELMDLLEQSQKQSADGKTPATDNTHNGKRYVYGIAGIARLFNCSLTTANRIKASGKIAKAISQYGRTITVDADLALGLMKQFNQ